MIDKSPSRCYPEKLKICFTVYCPEPLVYLVLFGMCAVIFTTLELVFWWYYLMKNGWELKRNQHGIPLKCQKRCLKCAPLKLMSFPLGEIFCSFFWNCRHSAHSYSVCDYLASQLVLAEEQVIERIQYISSQWHIDSCRKWQLTVNEKS